MNEVGDPDPRVGADGGVLADVVDLTPYLADLESGRNWGRQTADHRGPEERLARH